MGTRVRKMEENQEPIFIGEEQITNNKFLNMKVAAYRLPSGKVLEYQYEEKG